MNETTFNIGDRVRVIADYGDGYWDLTEEDYALLGKVGTVAGQREDGTGWYRVVMNDWAMESNDEEPNNVALLCGYEMELVK